MRVLIAGGHGKIALQLERLLAENGHHSVGIIRNVEQADDLRTAGAEPAVLDLENAELTDVVQLFSGIDAAVFAAGAGPGSGAARKDTVDRGAAVLFARAAEQAGVRRHIQVSAMGLARAEDSNVDETFKAYLHAKKAAEDDLRARDLAWTILRPGRLTNEAGTAMIHLADSVEPGEISRNDVAAVLLALLPEERTASRTLELVGGHTPIDEAVARI